MALQVQYLIICSILFLSFMPAHELRAHGHPLHISKLIDGSKFEDFKEKNSVLSHIRELGRSVKASTSCQTFNVDDFGAEANGTDDTKAFLNAWKKACSSKRAILVVPKKNYLLKPIRFEGPCNSGITMQINGTLVASDDRSDYKNRHWIVFESVTNLLVQGGTMNGKGKIWWQHSCKVNKNLPCKGAPTAVTFNKCQYLKVRDLKVKDAQQMHVSFDDCNNVQASGLTITAPGNSPNTDGIHVTDTQNIQILRSVIRTGDDCISIESGTQNLTANNITCGPGHGISIGSLGDGNSKAYVSGIIINGAKLSGTTNGVRIKTYQGGSGSATNIKFQNIEMDNVENPIIINQNYCDQKKPCKEQSSAVQVKNVLYKNIRGTTASDVAIKFDCSKNYPCQGIKLEDVKIATTDKKSKAECNNVRWTSLGDVSPQCGL